MFCFSCEPLCFPHAWGMSVTSAVYSNHTRAQLWARLGSDGLFLSKKCTALQPRTPHHSFSTYRAFSQLVNHQISSSAGLGSISQAQHSCRRLLRPHGVWERAQKLPIMPLGQVRSLWGQLRPIKNSASEGEAITTAAADTEHPDSTFRNKQSSGLSFLQAST